MADEVEDNEPKEVNPVIERDPEVLAEVKKNRLLQLKLERWKETAGAVGVVLQTFKAEAMSLTSGVGTLVVGWFQIRKWVAKGRAEVKAEGRAQGTAEGRVAGRAAERAERRADRAEAAGQGYGSGQGQVAEGRARKPASAPEPPPPPGGEMMAMPSTSTNLDPTPFMLDPMNYVTVGLPVIFIWSTVLAWFKRRRKQLEKKGGTNV
jgi:hypothetical protein